MTKSQQLRIKVERKHYEDMRAATAAMGTSVCGFIRRVLESADWTNPKTTQIIFSVPNELANDPDTLRRALHSAIDEALATEQDVL